MKTLLSLGYYPYRYSKSSHPKGRLYLEWTYYPKNSYSGFTIVSLLKLNPDENTNILASSTYEEDEETYFLATKIYRSFPRCETENLFNFQYFLDGTTFETVLNFLKELLPYRTPELNKRLEKIIHIDARKLTSDIIHEIVKDLSQEGQLIALEDIIHGLENFDEANKTVDIRILSDSKESKSRLSEILSTIFEKFINLFKNPLVKAANQGDATVQYHLGGLYYRQGDVKQAEYWWKKAANQEQVDAQNDLNIIESWK